jgi:hypothetical protein
VVMVVVNEWMGDLVIVSGGMKGVVLVLLLLFFLPIHFTWVAGIQLYRSQFRRIMLRKMSESATRAGWICFYSFGCVKIADFAP